MKLWDIVKSVGSAALQVALPGTGSLIVGALNLGSIINRYIDVRFEERRERTLTQTELESRILKLEDRRVKVEKRAHRAHNKTP